MALLTVFVAQIILYPQKSRAEHDEFRVSDSIEMTQIVDPPVALAFVQALDFNVSPDGERTAIVTRKGNLEEGVNEYALRLLDTRAALAAIASRRTAQQHVAISFLTPSPKHAIERVIWRANSQQLYFLGRDNGGAARVYNYDIGSGACSPVTPAGIDVATYDVSRAGDVLIFSAVEAPDWTERNRRGYRLRHHIALDLSSLTPPDELKHLRHYALHLRTGKMVSLNVPLSYLPRDFSISPSGRWAVVLGQVHDVPYSWHKYHIIAQYSASLTRSLVELPEQTQVEYDDALNRPAAWIQQFYLLDLKTGDAQIVVDAPSVNTGIPVRALWSEDERSFVLPGTYLPYDAESPDEARRRQSLQAIVEIDRQTLKAHRIVDLPEEQPNGKWLFMRRLELLSNDTLRIELAEYLAEGVDIEYYKKTGSSWWKADAPADRGVHSAKVSYSIVQAPQKPPEIAATDPRTQQSAVISDFNPELRRRQLGAVTPFKWTDKLGRQFEGGLVLPPGYQPERRYPVVVQTYGFDKAEFLVDGPHFMATAYAAQPLAGKGIVVLQIPGLNSAPTPGTTTQPVGELERFQVGLEAALQALDERRIADMTRVGIIGFSREGLHVHYALTFSRFQFAAAILSDCITATPMSYVLAYGYPRPGMLEWEDEGLIGVPLWGAGAAEWFARSPLFHLEQIRTPLRLETIGTYVPPLFETFAILKRHHRPVEMIHIPGDTHNLQTPWGRYTSQQGTVDWFSFWLLNQEDQDPEKSEQYKYWHILRQQQEVAAQERSQLSRSP